MSVVDPIVQNRFAETCRAELVRIADWWLEFAVDPRGGFYGEINNQNVANPSCNKCIILNSRILWFFAEAGRLTQRPEYLAAALRSFEYIKTYFYDREYGGLVWSVDATGAVQGGRKHTYGQAFGIYGLSAYYKSSGCMEALNLALELFDVVEQNAKDRQYGGYFEAFNRQWQSADDIRLSEKEGYSPKTMNTNLHVLEAYTELHGALRELPGKGSLVADALLAQLDVFCRCVFNAGNRHLKLFMDEQWGDQSKGYSYGHDIESSWLIKKAVDSLSTHKQTNRFTSVADQLADMCLREGITRDGALADEYEWHSQLYSASAWWVQAEALVGFAYAWKSTEDPNYLLAMQKIWRVIQEQYIDHEHGEWFWYAKKDHPKISNTYKVGPWKAPYHNGRAMIELFQLSSRFDTLNSLI